MLWTHMAHGLNGDSMETTVSLGAWVLISLSLFNGLALLWLGLTTFLAAQERRFGLWLILIGMVMAGLFFLSHTAILADQLALANGISVGSWWKISWLPIIIAPLLWYMLILWYAGFWEEHSHPLRWHRYPLAILFVYATLLIGLHIFAQPLPSFAQMTVLDFSDTIRMLGVPVMLILFPPYAILCVLLPLYAIQHPAPPRYEFGNLARQRAHPWLMRTSALLLVVAVVVTSFIVYVIRAAQDSPQAGFRDAMFTLPLILFDLGVTGMIAVVIVSLGQAVTAYEIFTGKTLPRRGFARQWYTALGIAAMVSTLIGYSLIFHPHPIYALVTLAGITMIGYAWLSWRTFVHRDRTIANLRPFVNGQSLMQNMINPEHDPLSQAQALFESMCEAFLGTKRAQITPDKALSLLVSTPLVYPPGTEPATLSVFSGDKIQQIDAQQHADFHWLIPLWSERGRIGVMLLGEKTSRGLFTEEEIQVAQAAGERILDMFAGEIMAQHLVRLQRRRMTEQRVMDFQTRRALHDKSLPALHEAILSLSTSKDSAVPEIIRTLSLIHKDISNLIHTTPDFTVDGQANDFLAMLHNDIQHEFAGEFEHIHWQLSHRVKPVDGLTADILFGAVREAVRNAAIHGRGDNPKRALRLWITVHDTDAFCITIRDNGIGPNADHHSMGGSGGGLALHGTLMALMGGSLSIEAADEGGTLVCLSV